MKDPSVNEHSLPNIVDQNDTLTESESSDEIISTPASVSAPAPAPKSANTLNVTNVAYLTV
jgi:hypothetical protein